MATPFRFKLDKVLDFRRQLEEQAMLALAQARQRYAEQADRVEALRAEQAEAEARQARECLGTAADLWLWRSYRQRLAEDLAQANLRLQQLAELVTQARNELITKARERKLLEKLKHRQAAAHAKDAQLHEQKTYDELATIRFEHTDFQAL